MDRSRCGSGITCRGDSQGRVDSLFLIIDRRRQQYSRSRRGPFTRTHLRLIAFQGQRNDGSGGTNGPNHFFLFPSPRVPFSSLFFFFFISFARLSRYTYVYLYFCPFFFSFSFLSLSFFFHFREVRYGRLMIKLKPSVYSLVIERSIPEPALQNFH